MKPEVKKFGTEQIKKKARESLIARLEQEKKAVADREAMRQKTAEKKQNMEL